MRLQPGKRVIALAMSATVLATATAVPAQSPRSADAAPPPPPVAARAAGPAPDTPAVLDAPRQVLAVYPVSYSETNLPSKRNSANAKPFSTAMLKWFGYYHPTTPADQQDPRVTMVRADLHGLSPTTIINAQIDPLRSDGETLAQAMRAAGDRVEQRTFPGVTHEMFRMGMVVRGAMDADMYAVTRLKAAFAATPMRSPRR